MKVKILLVPLAIVIAISLGVWLAYPAYSNGTDGVREKVTLLKKEKEKSEEIREKIGNANKLSAEIESLSTDRDILFEFIPVVSKEEQIYDSLNYLASKSSLAVFEITAVDKKRTIDVEAATIPMDETETIEKLPKIENSEVNVRMAGSYEKIKEFLIVLERSGRHSSFYALEIKKEVAKGEQKNDANVLWLNFTANYDVLKEAKASELSIKNPVFSQEKLDTKIISQIKDKKDTERFNLSVGQQGKANIFIP